MDFDPKPEPFTGKQRADQEALDKLLNYALTLGFYNAGEDIRNRPLTPPQIVLYFDQQMLEDGTPIPPEGE